MRSCLVPGCNNSQHPNSSSNGISFHRFPKNENRRMEWLQAMGSDNVLVSDKAVVCSVHFTEDSFRRSASSGLVRLKENSFPSIFFEKVSYDDDLCYMTLAEDDDDMNNCEMQNGVLDNFGITQNAEVIADDYQHITGDSPDYVINNNSFKHDDSVQSGTNTENVESTTPSPSKIYSTVSTQTSNELYYKDLLSRQKITLERIKVLYKLTKRKMKTSQKRRKPRSVNFPSASKLPKRKL